MDDLLAIVAPVFEDRPAASRLFREIVACLGEQVYIVAVDDGSIADPLCATDLAEAGAHGVVIALKRNVGHQCAIAVGLDYVARHLPGARRVVVMDADGEDVPTTIATLLHVLSDSRVDVVVAQRRRRVASLRFKALHATYKLVFGLLTGRRIDFGNYMVMTGAAAQRLAAMGELRINVAGAVLVSRLRRRACLVDRGARYSGRSRMNFAGLALHGMRALEILADEVLLRVGGACFTAATAGLLAAGVALGFEGLGYASPVWFWLAIGLLLLAFLLTGAIALTALLGSGLARSSPLLPFDYGRLIHAVTPARPVGDA